VEDTEESHKYGGSYGQALGIQPVPLYDHVFGSLADFYVQEPVECHEGHQGVITEVNEEDYSSAVMDNAAQLHSPETITRKVKDAEEQYSIVDELLLLPVYAVDILEEQYREYDHAHDIGFNVEERVIGTHKGILT
jgi:hypothetical protein